VDRSSVEPCTAAAHREEQLTLERIKHYPELEPSAALVGDRHAELRDAMREIGGVVEWLNNLPMLDNAILAEESGASVGEPGLFASDYYVRHLCHSHYSLRQSWNRSAQGDRTSASQPSA